MLQTPRPFYLEALSSLAAAYVTINLDESKGVQLPPRVDMQLEELESSWYGVPGGGVVGRGGFGQQQEQQLEQHQQKMLNAAKAEDTLEDVMYWTGQLAEVHPEFADKVCTYCLNYVWLALSSFCVCVFRYYRRGGRLLCCFCCCFNYSLLLLLFFVGGGGGGGIF